MSERVLVTGAAGFVGHGLVKRLVGQGRHDVLALTRARPARPLSGARYLLGGDLGSQADWRPQLEGVKVLVHSAARVHVLNERAANPEEAFARVNAEGTLQLARQAAAAGVRRFIFISSIGVLGAQTEPGSAFSEDSPPHPHNAYSRSKLAAECGLRLLAANTGLDVVIIRPPSVYGPEVKANFASLMHAVQRGWPLPLGAAHNLRSLVALDNLVDFIVNCIDSPAAADQTFLISDGHDISTAGLIRGLADAGGVPARLFPAPLWLLKAGFSVLGRANDFGSLFGNLQVDISKARGLMGWVPPISVDEGLRRAMAGWS